MVYWRLPREGCFKCNIDGASKGNPGSSAADFCTRNWNGDFVYATSHDLGIKSSIETEFWTIMEGQRWCIDQTWLLVVLEIDSVMADNY